jgi:probable rRNA maturation factor
VEISILFDIESAADRIDERWLKRVTETALAAEDADFSSEVSLVITGQEKIQDLNRTYLDEDRPTDVLSFPMFPATNDKTGFVAPPDGLKHLGEIIISLPQAEIQASEHGHSLDREIAVLLVHGVLHLLGYDHAEPEDTQKMQEREKTILGKL